MGVPAIQASDCEPDHPAHRPGGALGREVGGHAGEAGGEHAGHAGARDHLGRVEHGQRRRRGRQPGAGHRQQRPGHDQRPHSHAVDQRPDRQRHRHRGGREHRAGEPDGAERRVELVGRSPPRGAPARRSTPGWPWWPGPAAGAAAPGRSACGAIHRSEPAVRRLRPGRRSPSAKRSSGSARPPSTAATCSATAGPCLKPCPEPPPRSHWPGIPGRGAKMKFESSVRL